MHELPITYCGSLGQLYAPKADRKGGGGPKCDPVREQGILMTTQKVKKKGSKHMVPSNHCTY